MKLAGCIILENGKILLLNRKKTGWYELPGGKIGDSENAGQAAVREFAEELCCSVQIMKEIGRKDFIENGFVINYTWFLAKITSGRPAIGEPEKFSHFKFIPLAELKNKKLSPNMQNLLQEIRNGNIRLDE
jgi:8-oxo-dGTP diphosphatase